MANKKISELPTASAPTGGEISEEVQGGINVKRTPFAFTGSALTDAASIDITSNKHTLTTASSRTFTISYTGDDITIEVTLTATSANQTFPATALCVSEGVASGNNVLAMVGVSGDKYMIAIKKVGSAYYVVGKNFGQQ